MKNKNLSVRAETRSSTWTKLFDINNEGLTEHNYQAYTYDFYISNNTRDEIASYTFKFTFDREVFLFLAWNGSLEIHQFLEDGERVNLVPDLREFDPSAHDMDISVFDGEPLIHMRPGDFFIYHPSSSENAMEVPVEPYEGVVPGIILYTPIGENIDGSVLLIDYTFHRLIYSDPVFIASLVALGVWLIALIVFCIMGAQYVKYKRQHDHDNEILSHFKSLPNVNEGARYHHERYDGKGYPEGKAGEDIPLIARMICVADSYDAMNSNRVYRKKLSREDIINEIERNKGTQFDPVIADIFLKIIKSGRADGV